MRKDTILITGANGQLGSVLTEALRKIHGPQNVITSDIRQSQTGDLYFEHLNILDAPALGKIIDTNKITQIYHLAAILSAKGEANPLKTWEINMTGLFNVLEVAKEKGLDKIYFPSSIAVFGNDTPREFTPQNPPMTPETVYGMSKLAGEKWCNYYSNKYDLDIRSLRYPGVIGWQSMPGGGTTDYAVEIYHAAVQGKTYNCFLEQDTRLPMIYMEDAIRATIELMNAPKEKITVQTSYNLGGMSFSPKEIACEIQNSIPNFKIQYQPDFRQAIAETWSEKIDDSQARKDWAWKPKFDLASMSKDMLFHLNEMYSMPVV